MHEWPLVVYTLIAQTVAGAFAVLHLPPVSRRIDPAIRQRTGLILIAAACVGTGISFFHLGQPLRGVFVFTNLASSWLSREIAAQLLFIAGMVLVSAASWKLPENETLRRVLPFFTGCFGLTLVYCMSRIYMIPAIPAWNTALTPLSFFTTAALLGSLAVLSLAAVDGGADGCRLHRYLLAAAGAGALVRIFILFSRTTMQPRGMISTVLELFAIAVYVVCAALSAGTLRETGFMCGRRRITLLFAAVVFAELITRAGFYDLNAGGM
ncbi:dimethyl sulfoxide reductase anchor subunit [bacterium]|nr:dimethyl sulfoxide reductase anchor subunit [bacterium]